MWRKKPVSDEHRRSRSTAIDDACLLLFRGYLDHRVEPGRVPKDLWQLLIGAGAASDRDGLTERDGEKGDPSPRLDPAARSSRNTYLTTTQAAEHLNLSRKTLEKWRLDHRGPAYCKFGNKVLYRLEDLMEWADAQPRFDTTAEPAA